MDFTHKTTFTRSNSMKRFNYLVGFVLALILAGCVPTRYAWSPDGNFMTVIGDDGSLRIADADGKLAAGALDGVSAAAWFPDSRRLAVSHQIDVAHWDELVKYLSPAQQQLVTADAARIHDFALTYDWTAPNAGTWEAFHNVLVQKETQIAIDEKGAEELALAMAICLRDHGDEGFLAKFPEDRRKELNALTLPVHEIEVCDVSADGITRGKQIMTSLKGIHDMRVSPTGEAVLVSMDGTRPHDAVLCVIPSDGSRSPVQLSDAAAWYADWSPDGRDVYFIRANSPLAVDDGSQRLGALSHARVIDVGGAFAAKTPSIDDIAGLLYSEYSRVRCTKTGQVLFASADVRLPSTSADMPDRPQLFSIYPGRQAIVTRVLTTRALQSIGDSAQYFEVSPDGFHASVPNSDGKVDVVDLRTGDAVEVQGKPVMSSESKPTLITIPQWRSNDDLTFMAPGPDGQPMVQLWSISKNSGKAISAGWPAGSVAKKAEQSEPAATEPAGL
jgi:WD40 repeat protein